MSETTPTIVLVHGAFAESASWSPVIDQLQARGLDVVAALDAYPVATGGVEFAIRPELFHHQFAADVPEAQAAVMAATQRPVTQAALAEGLPSDTPAWRDLPSWFVFGDQDLNIPAELHRFMAERAGAKVTRELAGASHALSLSEPEAVAATILEATAVP